MDNVAATFRNAGRLDPSKDANGGDPIFLRRLRRGFSNADPSTKQQKAITPSLLRHMASRAKTPEQIAASRLAIGAFFFAMRSCEYSEVSGPRRTKLLQVKDFRFIKNRRIIQFADMSLQTADTVSITFTFQKNDERDDTVTMHSTTDSLLNPVRIWAMIIQDILLLPGSSTSSSINTYKNILGNLDVINSSAVLKSLRSAAAFIGFDILGCHPDDIGTHSLRSGGAMAMCLNDIPVYTIMLIGRWLSDAFMRYIRKQVQQFSRGIAQKMINSPDFFTIPDVQRPSSSCQRRTGMVHSNNLPPSHSKIGPTYGSGIESVSLSLNY